MEKYFRMVLNGMIFYVRTNKTRVNNADAQKILDKYITIKKIDIKEISKQIIINSLNSIKYQMELVDVRIKDNTIYYHNKYGGGIDFIDNETFLI